MAKPFVWRDGGIVNNTTSGWSLTGTFTTGSTESVSISSGDAYQLSGTCVNPCTIKFQKENNMRGLFIVYVVNGVKGEVVWTTAPFVADNAEKAKMKAAQEGTKDLDLDDLDFVVLRLGDVRPKERVKEVKVVS